MRDKGLFGLTVAERMTEDTAEANIAFGAPFHATVRDDEEAADYTAEIMAEIGAEHCAICERYYLPEDDCPLCLNCQAYEEQKARDHRDEVETYHLVSAGVG